MIVTFLPVNNQLLRSPGNTTETGLQIAPFSKHPLTDTTFLSSSWKIPKHRREGGKFAFDSFELAPRSTYFH